MKINPLCAHNLAPETTSHYLLGCHLFQTERRFLLTDIKEIDELIIRLIYASSFHVKWQTTEKIELQFFKRLLLVLKKIWYWEEDWALVYHFMKFWDIFGICFFPKILSLKLCGNSRGNPYIPYLLLFVTFHFTYCKRNIW